MYNLYQGDCLEVMKQLPDNSVDCIVSDIPYGINYDSWDVLHSNTNSALLGCSPAQQKCGAVFKTRGKPLNGWSKADREISKEYYEWCCKWSYDCLRLMKPGSSMFIFAGRRYAHKCISALEDTGFIFKDMISWQKESSFYRAQRVSAVFDRRNDSDNAERWSGWKLGNLRPIFEPILWFMKPYKIGTTLVDNIIAYEVGGFNEILWKKYTSSDSNIISIKSDKSDHNFHPTQKPILLLNALIELVTIKNQVVLDMFMGSGSTGVACIHTGRKFIGIEREEQYFNIAETRIKEAFNNLNKFME
jgi:site-specific DNA-methyltransferase (adenine-specific)